MRKINQVKLFVNDDKKSKDVAKKIEKELIKNNFIISDKGFELAISIGGDGTFLKMVRDNKFNTNIYYIGINSGTLGFLQEIDINATTDFIDRLNINDFKEEKISFLKTIVYTSKKEYHFNSLNEIVVRNNDFSVFKTKVYIDKEFLENFVGDGLLISTSTGSTAYNMSFGGSIIYNTLNAFILTPIAPINNKAYNTLTNSLVIPNEKKITLKGNINNLFFMNDGRNIEINGVLKIESIIEQKKIKCIRMNDFHFIKVINKKIIDKS